MSEKALILVDLEKEWIQQWSAYYVGDISSLVENTNKLLHSCRRKGYKIIFIRHIEQESNSAFSPQSSNIEIIPEIEKQDTDTIIDKYKISPFFKTNLEQELSGIQQVVIWWILTNLCVRSCVQDAYDRDFQITIITDCCQAFTREIHEFTLQDLKATREDIEIKTTQEFARENQ